MQFKIFLILSTIWMISCQQNNVESDDNVQGHSTNDIHGHEHGTMASDDEHVSLSNVQIENIGLKYGKITPRKIRSTVQLTGRIELPPSGKAVASSALEGKIVQVHVEAGQFVNRGQKLFTIQNLEVIDWQQLLAEEIAELQYLERDLVRQKQLSDQQLAPVKNYESVLSRKQQTQARIRAHRSKLGAIGIDSSETDEFKSTFDILAPSSGTVQHLMVSNGEHISTTSSLAEIINNRNLHLHLLAYGEEIKHLSKNQILNFYVQSRPEQIMEARIFWINEMVNSGNNSYDVHAEITGDVKGLSPGEFAEARVINQERTVPTLPNEAVTYDKGLYYIFSVDGADDESIYFEKIQVNIGTGDLGFTEILPIDPLPEGSDVVVDGAFFLMAESKKGEEGAGHSH